MGPSFRSGRPTAARSAFSRAATCGASTYLERRRSYLARALDSRGGTWNADGTIVFSPNAFGPLYQVSASGGTPTPLTTLSAGETSHRWPKFLPDGRTLLYFVQGTEPGVYLTTLDRPGNTKRVFNAASEATYVPGQRNSRDTCSGSPGIR